MGKRDLVTLPRQISKLLSMNWITTIELGKFLIAHPNNEYECRMKLGGGIG